MSSSAPARILVLGSGGREHALAWRLLVGGGRTPRDDREVFLSPGNPGAARDVPCLRAAKTPADVVRLAQDERIDLVVVGPEQPLVDGVVDALEGAGVCVLGPSQHCATLEGSKAFMKDVAAKANVPTAAYGVFTDESDAIQFLQSLAETDPRVAIKADGLCAGKGVVLTSSLDDSIRVVKSFLGSDGDDARFGDASTKVVIEQFLDGVELSVFALCDGDNAHLFATARDHKRLLDGDEGPNTGGMGAYSPAPVLTQALQDQVMARIVHPTLEEMAKRGTPYSGVLYVGLMIKDGEARVNWADDHAMTVVLAAKGYPGAYAKGTEIGGLEALPETSREVCFHAGTKAEGGKVLANGGRVLNVTARGATLQEARDKAYAMAEAIDWPEGFYRSDIGWRVLG